MFIDLLLFDTRVVPDATEKSVRVVFKDQKVTSDSTECPVFLVTAATRAVSAYREKRVALDLAACLAQKDA